MLVEKKNQICTIKNSNVGNAFKIPHLIVYKPYIWFIWSYKKCGLLSVSFT